MPRKPKYTHQDWESQNFSFFFDASIRLLVVLGLISYLFSLGANIAATPWWWWWCQVMGGLEKEKELKPEESFQLNTFTLRT